ncbi:MAG: hypothetical protein CMJ34_14650 [Phycisphaerae bacterium]|nr:hypothetical protein [Phycisphaerae bacterium]
MASFGGIFQKKSQRPRVRPARTGLDNVLWFAAIAIGITLLVYGLTTYPKLPATIPGRNGPEPSWTVLIMPCFGSVLVGVMLLLQRWPWMSNTVVAITEENAEIQYRLVNRLLSVVSIEIGLIFLLVTWDMVGRANGNPTVTPLVFVITTMSWLPVLGWYFLASFRHA